MTASAKTPAAAKATPRRRKTTLHYILIPSSGNPAVYGSSAEALVEACARHATSGFMIRRAGRADLAGARPI